LSGNGVSLYLNSYCETAMDNRPEGTKAFRPFKVSRILVDNSGGRAQDMKSALINGMMGGFMGFVMSFLVNYFIFELPRNITVNALGNGMSGLISGFMGGFIGVMVHINKKNSAA